MDDAVKRAEELLEERMRSQRTNGHAAVDDAPEGAGDGEGPPKKSRSDTEAEESRSDTKDTAALTRDDGAEGGRIRLHFLGRGAKVHGHQGGRAVEKLEPSLVLLRLL